MQGAENTEKQQLSASLRARMWEYRMISVILDRSKRELE